MGTKSLFEPSTVEVTKYTIGDKPYNPRVDHNKVSWDKILVKLSAGKNGQATGKELASVLGNHATKVGEHHLDFVGYLLHRGALKVV